MTYALEIKNLHKTYENGFTALKGIDLAVTKGDFFALLGANGAGKSTTIGIITSLVNKTKGSVSVFGSDLDTDLVKVKSHIGVVPQEFNFNIFEKVEDIVVNQAGFYGIPKKIAKQRAEYYLKKLELWDKRGAISQQLSGGMKRRLMIARAMIHEPELLILDEPTAGVDLEIRRSMWDFIRDMNEKKGTTIILTTHYLEEAEQLCKNIAIIDEGRVVVKTDMKTLLSKLDVETVVLDLFENIEMPTEELGSLIKGYNIKMIAPRTLEVEIKEGKGLTPLFDLLSEQNITVKSMRNKSNRLEELFINLVGKKGASNE